MKQIRITAIDGAFLVVGGIVALLLMPLAMYSMTTIQVMVDTAWPPTKMAIHSAKYTDPVTLEMQFEVTRQKECSFTRMVGFSGDGRLDMEPAATLRKLDKSDVINYPVGITVISPPWVMFPIFGPHIMIYGHYDCNGRQVRQLVIDEVVNP